MPGAFRGLILVLLIGAAGVAGFVGYRQWQDHRHATGKLNIASATAAPVPASPSLEAPQAVEAPTPVVPQTVPDIKLPDLKGEQKSLRDFLGRPLIINFWATWCGPCRREIPLLLQLRQVYRGERLEVIGIAVDFPAAVTQYLQTSPISYPVLVGQDQGYAAAEKFGMEPVLPFSVFADAQGSIIAVKVGELHKDEADYILGAMRQIAAGKKSIEDARSNIAEKLRTFAVQRAKAGSGQR